MRRAFALLPLALVIVITAGCGGGGTETVTQVRTQTSAAPLTKAEYIAQADPICKEFRDKIDPLEQEAQRDFERSDYEAATGPLSEGLKASREEYEKLKALPKPEGDEAVLDQMFDKANQSIAIAERAVDQLIEDQAAASELFDQAKALNDEVRGIATGYGFKVCGQGD